MTLNLHLGCLSVSDSKTRVVVTRPNVKVNYTLKPWKLQKPPPQHSAEPGNLVDTDTVVARGYGRQPTRNHEP